MKKKGFTLIELLAVIVIVGILLIVSIPAIISSMREAKQKSFALYAQKVLNSAQTKYQVDKYLDGTVIGGIAYDIKTDIGLADTGEFEGFVVVDPCISGRTNYTIGLWDGNFQILKRNAYNSGTLPSMEDIDDYNVEEINEFFNTSGGLTKESVLSLLNLTTCRASDLQADTLTPIRETENFDPYRGVSLCGADGNCYYADDADDLHFLQDEFNFSYTIASGIQDLSIGDPLYGRIGNYEITYTWTVDGHNFSKTVLYTITGAEIEVTFDAQGGSVYPPSKIVIRTGKYESLPTPTGRAFSYNSLDYNYSFYGWYYQNNRITSSSIVTASSDHSLLAYYSYPGFIYNDYSCASSGAVLSSDNTKCITTVPANPYNLYTCPMSYTGGGRGDANSSCTSTYSLESCPSGYETVNETTCRKYTEVNGTLSYLCNNPQYPNGGGSSSTCSGQFTQNGEPFIDSYNCPSGYTYNSSFGSCVKYYPDATQATTSTFCSETNVSTSVSTSGYTACTYNASACGYKNGNMSYPMNYNCTVYAALACNSGGTLQPNGTCLSQTSPTSQNIRYRYSGNFAGCSNTQSSCTITLTTTGTVNYLCNDSRYPNGGGSNPKCNGYDIYNRSGCTGGYTLQSDNITCKSVVTGNLSIMYECTGSLAGYTLQSPNCVKTENSIATSAAHCVAPNPGTLMDDNRTCLITGGIN